MNAPLQMQTKAKPGAAPAAAPAATGLLQRQCACGGSPGMDGECAECRAKRLQRQPAGQAEPVGVPPIVHDVLRAPGRPLDAETRAFMEPRFGHDFSRVRVHTDAQAAESARAVNALAYTVGRDVVFATGQYAPHLREGRGLLAHELTHMVHQQGQMAFSRSMKLGPDADAYEQEADQIAHLVNETDALSPVIRSNLSAPVSWLQPYRRKKAFNFGLQDTSTLKEEEFKDPKTQPWIAQIKLHFDSTKTDTNSDIMPIGNLEATYSSNSAALPNVTMPISGGAHRHGLTDRGNFTVHRIEGIGYNDVPIPLPDGEGPRRKYSKSLNASMHFAVFFKGGQAIHIGDLNLGSHACAHAGNGGTAFDKMQQINYHSVVGRTKVDVSYAPTALADACCARMKFLGITKKGDAWNPCQGQDPTSCP